MNFANPKFIGQNGAGSRCTLTYENRSHSTVGSDRLFIGYKALNFGDDWHNFGDEKAPHVVMGGDALQ
jgi:hypothetical protein